MCTESIAHPVERKYTVPVPGPATWFLLAGSGSMLGASVRSAERGRRTRAGSYRPRAGWAVAGYFLPPRWRSSS